MSHTQDTKAIRCGAVRRAAICLAASMCLTGMAHAQSSFQDLLGAKGGGVTQGEVRLTPVREAALRDTAQVLGVQWGLGDRSRELDKLLDAMGPGLDRKFAFGPLALGAGFMPPVISEARDARAIEGRVLKIAKRVYKIVEEPRPAIVVPTWRDWLYQGLDVSLRPTLPAAGALLPRDDMEQRYWRQELQRAYEEGRKQAQDVFDLNLSRLKITHEGMQRYYDLYKRGVVSAPVVAAATSMVDKGDPDTILIGNMVIRVTVPAGFVGDTDKWVPLAQ